MMQEPLSWTEALEAAVRAWAGRISVNFRMKVDDGDDFVQDCILKSYREVAAGKIQHRSALYTLCYRLALDGLRKTARRPVSVHGLNLDFEKSDWKMPEIDLMLVCHHYPELAAIIQQIEGGDDDIEGIAASLEMTKGELSDWIHRTRQAAKSLLASKVEGTMTGAEKLQKLTTRGNFRAKVAQIVQNMAAAGYDPRVFETIRTIEKQREYVRRGVSKTLNSRHLPDHEGLASAADIVQDDQDPWSTKSTYDRRFWIMLGRFALIQGCDWGGLWIGGKNDPRRAKLRAFLLDTSKPFDPDGWTGALGWDLPHVQRKVG